MAEKVEILEIDLTDIQKQAKETGKTLKDLRTEVKDLRTALDNTELGTEEFSKALSDLTHKQQELTNVTKSGIAAQKGSYNDLVNQMDILKRAWRATSDEAERTALGNQIREINSSLKELDSSVGNHQREVGNYRMVLKNLKADLLTLEEGTDEYNQKLLEAAEISQKMQDVNEFVASSAADLGDHISNVTQVASGLTGAFQTVQATMNLFGIESETFEKTIVTMQSLMAVTQGLQAVEGAIDPFKRLGIAIKQTSVYQALFKTTTDASSKSLSGFKKALIGTGIGAVVVAIGSLIAYWEDLKEMLGSTTKAQEEYNESVKKQAEAENERQKKLTESTGSIIAQYKLLQLEWKNLTNEQEKQKWIEKNANAFKQLGLNIKDVNDANRLLIEDSENVVKSLRLQTEALILRDSYTEAYKRKMESERTLKDFGSLNLNPNKYYSSDEIDSIPLPDDVKDELFDTYIKQSLTGVSYKLNETAFQTYNSTYRKSINDADKEIKELETRITNIDAQLKSLNTQTGNDSGTPTTTSVKDDLEDYKKYLEQFSKDKEKIDDIYFEAELSKEENEYNIKLSERTRQYNEELNEWEKWQQLQLTQLDKFKKDGIITEEEYNIQSEEIQTQYNKVIISIQKKYGNDLIKLRKEQLKTLEESEKERLSKLETELETRITKIQSNYDKSLERTNNKFNISNTSANNEQQRIQAEAKLLKEESDALTKKRDDLLKLSSEILTQIIELEARISFLKENGGDATNLEAELTLLQGKSSEINSLLIQTSNDINTNIQNTTNNLVDGTISKLDMIKEIAQSTKDILSDFDVEISNTFGIAIDGIVSGLDLVSSSLKKGEKGWVMYGQLAAQGLGTAAGILNSITEQQDESSEDGFNKQKQLQIASASMSMLAGVVSAVTSAFNPANAWMTIWGQAAAAATMSAMVIATGIMQINEIKKQQFNGGNSSTPSTPTPSMPAISAMSSPVQNSSIVEGASAESKVKDTRVYVLESDITDTQNEVKSIVSESEF